MDFESLGILGLFLSSFLAATLLPLSSEVVLFYLINEGGNLPMIIAVATIGNTLGGMFNYLIGHFGKIEWAHRYLKIKEKDLLKWQAHVQRYGSFLAFFCWLPIVGDPLALCLGLFKTNVWVTVSLMMLGKGLRYVVLVYFIPVG